jgi:polyhydroxyalkanoate synthesis regulator phasin
MATRKSNKPDEGGFVERLAGRGEEAVTRLLDELANNPRVTDALGRAMSAKGKVDAGARRTLSQVGLAAADELKDLRKQIERLERRLARLEGEGAGTRPSSSRSSAKRSETKKTPTARKGTKTTAKKDAEKTTSPAPGRAVGGGPGRGSSAGGSTAA